MGWWITLAVLILLAMFPLGVSAVYREGGARVRVIAGPVRFTVFPRKRKKTDSAKKETGKPAEKTQKPEKPGQNQKKSKTGGSLLDFLPLVRLALDFLGEFVGRKLRVNVLEVKVILAGDDPCDLAVNYGRAWTALGNLWPKLEEWLVIRKRNVQVECDFTASEIWVDARIDLTITVGRVLSMAVRYGFRALKEYLKIRKKRKGGVNL